MVAIRGLQDLFLCLSGVLGQNPVQPLSAFQDMIVTGRLGEALEAARRALELEPGNERLRGNAALLERLAGA